MASNKASLSVHEEICALRYEQIQARLDAGAAKFDKMERIIFGIYPFILAAVAIGKWL